jgi:hypothetical protein
MTWVIPYTQLPRLQYLLKFKPEADITSSTFVFNNHQYIGVICVQNQLKNFAHSLVNCLGITKLIGPNNEPWGTP